MYNEMCGDNRFEIIAKAKRQLLEYINIETSPDEMAVIDSDYGKFCVYYRVMRYYSEGKWDTTGGIVTHWAEIPEVYDIDDNKIL